MLKNSELLAAVAGAVYTAATFLATVSSRLESLDQTDTVHTGKASTQMNMLSVTDGS